MDTNNEIIFKSMKAMKILRNYYFIFLRSNLVKDTKVDWPWVHYKTVQRITKQNHSFSRKHSLLRDKLPGHLMKVENSHINRRFFFSILARTQSSGFARWEGSCVCSYICIEVRDLRANEEREKEGCPKNLCYGT